MALTSDSEFEMSSRICKNRLDRLKRENKAYTYEFLKYVTLLGVNSYYLTDINKIWKRQKIRFLKHRRLKNKLITPI